MGPRTRSDRLTERLTAGATLFEATSNALDWFYDPHWRGPRPTAGTVFEVSFLGDERRWRVRAQTLMEWRNQSPPLASCDGHCDPLACPTTRAYHPVVIQSRQLDNVDNRSGPCGLVTTWTNALSWHGQLNHREEHGDSRETGQRLPWEGVFCNRLMCELALKPANR